MRVYTLFWSWSKIGDSINDQLDNFYSQFLFTYSACVLFLLSLIMWSLSTQFFSERPRRKFKRTHDKFSLLMKSLLLSLPHGGNILYLQYFLCSLTIGSFPLNIQRWLQGYLMETFDESSYRMIHCSFSLWEPLFQAGSDILIFTIDHLLSNIANFPNVL